MSFVQRNGEACQESMNDYRSQIRNIAVKKKSDKGPTESASQRPFAGENPAPALSEAAAVERAFEEYLALPDAATIAKHTSLPNSPREALELLQAAKKEAWRIRVEMVRGWANYVFGTVWAKIVTEVGTVPEGARRVHPILGPLLSVYYGEKVPENKARLHVEKLEHAERLAKEERLKKRAYAKASNGAARQREAAQATNEKKEHGRMVECVKAFAKWKREHPEASHADCPKPSGMSLKRAQALRGTLYAALTHPSVNDDLLAILQREGFPTATGKAVAECLEALKNNIG